MAARDHFRAHGRRKTQLPAVLRDATGTLAQGARIRDLGLGGACVELDVQVGRGRFRLEDTVTLEVTAPSLWDPLTLRGRVAWMRVFDQTVRAGLRFEHRDARSLWALFQLLGAHAYEA